jgi:glycosyltransferase involved in cell wall biosynthesis
VSHVLTLMFSTTGSLAAYKKAGSYPRFLARLRAYAEQFEAVHVCTFDTHNHTADWDLPNAFHHPMPRLPATSVLYHVLSPIIHCRALRETTIIRAFNITAALPAMLLRVYTGAPVFVSYGYSLPDFVRYQSGRLKYWLYWQVEELALRGSDRIICATLAQMQTLGDRYGQDKVLQVPNFVDTERFHPTNEAAGDYLLFVGRLTAQKNLNNLLYGLRLALDQGAALPAIKIVGQGDQEETLRRLAAELQLSAEFCGTIPNDELPDWYAHAWAYVLPSHFEGMPKALLEAMSCEAPCIGSDVEGIRDLIEDGVNGLLVEPTPEGIAEGLMRLADDEELRHRVAVEGRRYVVENYSLAEILYHEIEILQEASR